jgi:hypothetical protein
VKLVKMLVNLVVATLVGTGGEKLFGPWGMILGFIAGGAVSFSLQRSLRADA